MGMLVSPAPKPEPVTVTGVPGAPLARLMVMVAAMVKVRSGTALACVVEPAASMAWGPEAGGGRVNGGPRGRGGDGEASGPRPGRAGGDARGQGVPVVGYGVARLPSPEARAGNRY